MEALDLPYLQSSRREMIRKRARWLTILLIGEMLTATALGEVRLADWWLVFRREITIGVVLGLILGVVASIRVVLWGAFGAYGHIHGGDKYLLIGMTVAAALVGCVLWGTLMGSMLPFVLRRAGADPASASAPLVATLVDVSGIIIYFTIARLILSSVLQ